MTASLSSVNGSIPKSAGGEVGISVMVELCQCVIGGKKCQMNGKQMCRCQFSR